MSLGLMSFGLLSVYRGRGIEGGAGEEVHVGEGLFPALRFAVMCVGWGGELAVIAIVVGEGDAYPLGPA